MPGLIFGKEGFGLYARCCRGRSLTVAPNAGELPRESHTAMPNNEGKPYEEANIKSKEEAYITQREETVQSRRQRRLKMNDSANCPGVRKLAVLPRHLVGKQMDIFDALGFDFSVILQSPEPLKQDARMPTIRQWLQHLREARASERLARDSSNGEGSSDMESQGPDFIASDPEHTLEAFVDLTVSRLVRQCAQTADRRCVSAKSSRGRARADRRRGLAQRRSLQGVLRAKNSQHIEQSAIVNMSKLNGQGRTLTEPIIEQDVIGKHAHLEEVQARPKRTVVLSLDYDGCSDVLFEGVDLRLRRRSMTKELEVMHAVRNTLQRNLESITAGADRVILMVGSNRQSVYVDQSNRRRLEMEIGPVGDEVGWVRHDFQKLAEEKGWELNRTLLADQENNVPPGTAWNNNALHVKFERGMDKCIKQSLIQYQFGQLNDIDGDIDFYFFDDKSEYLDFVRRQVVVPTSTHFFTVHFDWFSHVIEQKPMDLHAIDTEDRRQSLGARRSEASGQYE